MMGNMANNWVSTWLEIGKKNAWIRRAVDPPLTLESFERVECATPEELANRVLSGSWVLGQPFYWKDICLMNQIDGGDEWLVVKQDLAFESFTCRAIGREKLVRLLGEIDSATLEQCKDLEYSDEYEHRTHGRKVPKLHL